MPFIQQTVVNHNIGSPVIGYTLNIPLDKRSREEITDLQIRIGQKFGDIIWNTPANALHITLMDWIAPLVDYEKDKKVLFDELFPIYNTAFTQIIKDRKSITVSFAEVRVTSDAIIVVGQDKGEFNDIRSHFLRKVDLPPNTKQPPTIIHSTIARYKRQAKLEPITQFLTKYPLVLTLKVDHFRLVREDIAPQLKYEVLKEYHLS